jgi:hypothetical protein
MSTIKDKLSIEGFEPSRIDTTYLDEIEDFLPDNGVIDVNICERGLVMTLQGQNYCQEIIATLERWIGRKESEKSKAWAVAALQKAKEEGIKTAKEKEWFAQSEDNYIEAVNQLTLAKATKKWFENKSSFFSGWHYAFKTFLRRDYTLENLANVANKGYNDNTPVPKKGSDDSSDWGGDQDIPWEK